MKTIITDSIKNTNRIIRRDNDNGLSTFGTETITALGIAWQIVMESLSEKGITPARLINNATASAIVLKLIFEDGNRLPFVPLESICLSTAKEIYSNMNLIRCNTHKESSIDKDRVEYIERFIVIYEEEIKKRNLYDEPLVLKDAIDLLKNGKVKYKCDEIMTCYYNKPSELESEFVSLLGTSEVFPKPEGKEVTYKFVKTYGIVNEADYVAKTIIDNNIPLEDVEIICDTALYAPFIEEAFAKRELVYTFDTGISAAGLNLIVMIKDLVDWYASDCNYKEFFKVAHNPIYAIEVDGKQIRASKAFLKGISYGIGWGKDRYLNVGRSDYEKKYGGTEDEIYKTFREIELPLLNKLASEIDGANSSVEILDKLVDYARNHSFKRNQENRYTVAALARLRKDLSANDIAFSRKEDLLDYLMNELDILSYSMIPSGASTIVSNIYSPLVLSRKNVFILGLSAKEFKISNADSPVLNDDIRKEIFGNPPCGNVTLAIDNLASAERLVIDTIKSALDYSSITVVASNTDVMRDSSNVSMSSLFEKLKEVFSGSEIEENTYNEITDYSTMIEHKELWNEFGIEYDEEDEQVNLTFSKSSLDTFLNCPLQYQYQKNLFINEEDYTDFDPSRWLKSNDVGTFIHSILEKYTNEVLVDNERVGAAFDRKSTEFIKAVETSIKEIEKISAAPNEEIKKKEFDEYTEIAAKYLEFLHDELCREGWIVMSCEEEIESGVCSSRFKKETREYIIKYTGKIDRIDYKINPDGSKSYRIIDYKTGHIKSKEEMRKTTKQHLIYAKYVREKYKGKVESFEYQYISALSESPLWNAVIDEEVLKEEVISSSGEGINDEDLFDIVHRQHDYKALKLLDKDCRFCKYTDICLYNHI